MKAKALISSFIVILHLMIMMWYYSKSNEWLIIHKDMAYMMFYGATFFLIGGNMVLSASNKEFPIQVEITKFHGIFILLLGTIYALHYSGILITTNKEKLIMTCAGALTIIIIILISAWRHGFFNARTYDG